MPIKPRPNHWYERQDGEVVQYDGPNGRPGGTRFPHRVGGHSYTDRGRYMAGRNPTSWDLVKDLGTTDPRLKKPRKAPAKKFRKVRMHFFRDGDGELCASQWKTTAGFLHNASWGRSFSQIVSEPVPQKKKA